MRELTIKESESGQRLDKYLARYLKEAPKSFLYKMMRKKNIVLNGKKAEGSEKLKTADIIRLYLAEETLEKFSGEVLRAGKLSRTKGCLLDVLYEDDNVLFINKPAGMLSQKAKKEDISLVEYLIEYLLDTNTLSEEDLRTFHPAVCNRLDRNTTGIVAAGKTMAGLQTLSCMLKDRSLHKYYLTVTDGRIDKEAHIRGYLKKDEKNNKVFISDTQVGDALPIETRYTPLKTAKDGSCTLLQVELLTGRSHQIRSHLASIGHPIVGDGKYGSRSVNQKFRDKYRLNYQLLHAWKMELPEIEGTLSSLSGLEIMARPPMLFESVIKGEELL